MLEIKEINLEIERAEYFSKLLNALTQLKKDKNFNLVMEYLLTNKLKEYSREWASTGSTQSERALIGLFNLEKELNDLENLAIEENAKLKSLKLLQEEELLNEINN